MPGTPIKCDWQFIAVGTYHERMTVLTTREKLAILADAAKYDASCASSGRGEARLAEVRRHRLDRGHGHLPLLRAGRPLHLAAEDPADQLLHLRLRLLHQPRRPRNVPRARFTVDEVVRLTLDFYQRNYIEGLFLSSGIIRIARLHDGASWSRWRAALREDHDFARLHPPEDDPRSVAGAARRRPAAMPTGCRSTSSCRPTRASKRLAPEKKPETIRAVDGRRCALKIEEKAEPTLRTKKRQRFAPGGQSTQMIVGADAATDAAHPADQRAALRRLPAAARLLLRLQPDPGLRRRRCR